MDCGSLSSRLINCPVDAPLDELETLTQEAELIALPDDELCNAVVHLGSRLLMDANRSPYAERLFTAILSKRSHTEIAIHLITLYNFYQKHTEAIALSTQFAAGAKNLYTAAYGRSLLLNCLADAGGYWGQREKRSKQLLDCIKRMEEEGDRFSLTEAGRLILSCFRLYSEMDGTEIREAIESIGRMAV